MRRRRWMVGILLGFLVGACLALAGMQDSGVADLAQLRVDLDEARRFAHVTFVEMQTLETPSLTCCEENDASWARAHVGNVFTLYDVTTEPLFYVFMVEDAGNAVGRIWVSANRLIGPAVAAVQMGQAEPWDVESWDELLRVRLEEVGFDYSDAIEVLPIIYAYPRIGMMAVLADPFDGTHRFIIDVQEGVFVEPTLDGPYEGVDETEGTVGSAPWVEFLGAIPEDVWQERFERWDLDARFLEAVDAEMTAAGMQLGQLAYEPLGEAQLELAKELFQQLTDGYKLVVAGRGLPCSNCKNNVHTYCQEKGYYCSIATAQMIAAFYGVHHTQHHIQKLSKTVHPPTTYPDLPGTSPLTQLDYYTASLAQGGLGKAGSTVYTVKWNLVWNELEADRPVHTIIRTRKANSTEFLPGGHCRAAFAAKEYTAVPTGAGKQWLGICDPWKYATGCSCVWEDWDLMKPVYFPKAASMQYALNIHVKP